MDNRWLKYTRFPETWRISLEFLWCQSACCKTETSSWQRRVCASLARWQFLSCLVFSEQR